MMKPHRTRSAALTVALLFAGASAGGLLLNPSAVHAQDDDDSAAGGTGGSRGSGQRASGSSGSTDIGTPFTGQRPFQLDIHGGFSWWGVGVATGARFGIPILHNGFIDSINNAVYINFGVDFYWIRRGCNNIGPGGGVTCEYGPGVGIPVALHWEFYFNDNWSAFAEVGFQFFMHPHFFNNGRYEVYDGGYWFLAAVGGSFHINDNVLLTLRVGTPYAAFGVTFQF